MRTLVCNICKYTTSDPDDNDLGQVSGNTTQFKKMLFNIWRCPKCQCLHNIDEEISLANLYHGYPRFQETNDVLANATFTNVIKRLQETGLKKADTVLFYNLGNNQVFIDIMNSMGYKNVSGYNPYLEKFSKKPTQTFDYVVANDVLEHVPDVWEFIQECLSWVSPGGRLYIGTPDAMVVKSMKDLEKYSLALHQPFHRIIVTENALKELGQRTGLEIVKFYRRSYLDTRKPFANRRFMEELANALGNELERLYDTKQVLLAMLKHPSIIFYALLGYFFPSAYEPAIVLQT